jgi:type II secretory pathway predicted ATPase ExeA
MFNPRLSEVEFFDFMMADFGIPSDSALKSRTLMKLNQWLLDQHKSGTRAVLIVDEAQNLSADMLEEIRLLTNLETSTEKLLQIVLAGQPELEEKLNDSQLRQLRQRITLWAKTRPLTLLESHGYIKERLRIAGTGEEIFSAGAIEVVHRHARGIPRIINLLCEHALISAFVEHSRTVSEEIVEDVARDFDLQEIDREPASKPANAGHPILVDHGLPQAVRPSAVSLSKAAGEKKG